MPIEYVIPGSPAAHRGLKSDDVISHIDGRPINDVDGLMLQLGKQPADAVVRLTVERMNTTIPVSVELAKFPVVGKKIVTSPPPAWRGMHVDYATIRAGRENRIPDGVLVTAVDEDSPACARGCGPRCTSRARQQSSGGDSEGFSCGGFQQERKCHVGSRLRREFSGLVDQDGSARRRLSAAASFWRTPCLIGTSSRWAHREQRFLPAAKCPPGGPSCLIGGRTIDSLTATSAEGFLNRLRPVDSAVFPHPRRPDLCSIARACGSILAAARHSNRSQPLGSDRHFGAAPANGNLGEGALMETVQPRVVVVGGGFGGLTVVQRLAKAPVRVTLVDRRNHHLFQPLLYQVATAGLSPSDIASPIRRILRNQTNAEVLLAEAHGVDFASRTLLLDEGSVAYDYLVVATGARHSYFGHDEWSTLRRG